MREKRTHAYVLIIGIILFISILIIYKSSNINIPNFDENCLNDKVISLCSENDERGIENFTRWGNVLISYYFYPTYFCKGDSISSNETRIFEYQFSSSDRDECELAGRIDRQSYDNEGECVYKESIIKHVSCDGWRKYYGNESPIKDDYECSIIVEQCRKYEGRK